MRITNRRGCLALLVVVLAVIIIGLGMMWLNRQPRVTPASAGGSMQERLTPRTNPPH
ncbi:hypothetical protein HZF05_11170 [Sphingomonas sp. CGMCC 1.13654]|uniref:Uncharacterized protein n=1 Tax=Sphingomonas chungangi TaxID=2683589 RepID=A0A838L7H3_9SPHN|nr:hypothetical protein [Sphingomonas chungangi]MBA2934655.1 hypothetical protein [Sphingomonas chungangi]MVW57690.1 hypothetical protein [Sphingomonas chungangi]